MFTNTLGNEMRPMLQATAIPLCCCMVHLAMGRGEGAAVR
jgi:hypothetical protein